MPLHTGADSALPGQNIGAVAGPHRSASGSAENGHRFPVCAGKRRPPKRIGDFASLVAEAQERQARRYVNENFRFNGELDAAGVRRYCPLDEPGENLLKQAFRTLNFSGRAYHRILKLALTLADLEGHDRIRAEHLAEALQYRALDKS